MKQSNYILSASIPLYKDKFKDNKMVTFYEIHITNNLTNKTWSIDKRYNDFKELHNALKQFIPNIPAIPPTTYFRITSPEALNKRKDELQTFLKKCISMNHILFTDLFLDFLEVQTNAPNIKQNSAELFYDYKKLLALGLRDFILEEKKGVMFICCSEMNIISRVNADINGAFFIYQFEKNFKNPEERFIVHKIYAQAYPVQTGTLFYDDESGFFGVGLDDGKICIYHDPKNSHYVNTELYIEMSGVHTDRIMGLAFDNKHKCLFSCSKDKNFYVTYIKDDRTISPELLKTSSLDYTNLFFDKKNERIILTNKLGEISIFTNIDGMQEKATIQTTPLTCIRALDVNLYHNYVFTGTVNGKITISSLGQPGKEKFISEISTFGSEMKIRVCCFFMKNFELITGDETGRITIWSLKKGMATKMWLAHEMAITQMFLDEQNLLLYSGSKDKHIKVWKIPDHWVSEACDESKIITVEPEKPVKKKKKDEEKSPEELMVDSDDEEEDSSDSSKDDLNGWDYRDY